MWSLEAKKSDCKIEFLEKHCFKIYQYSSADVIILIYQQNLMAIGQQIAFV